MNKFIYKTDNNLRLSDMKVGEIFTFVEDGRDEYYKHKAYMVSTDFSGDNKILLHLHSGLYVPNSLIKLNGRVVRIDLSSLTISKE